VKGETPYQEADLLVKLRNYVTHYKSVTDDAEDELKLISALKRLNFRPPPFFQQHTQFFPFAFFSSSSARWAIGTSIAFLDAFYTRLGAGNPIDSYRREIDPSAAR